MAQKKSINFLFVSINSLDFGDLHADLRGLFDTPVDCSDSPPAQPTETVTELIETFHDENLAPRRELKRKFENSEGKFQKQKVKFSLN